MKSFKGYLLLIGMSLLFAMTFCACQEKVPSDDEVSYLMTQAENIYHANHPAFADVKTMLIFQNEDDPSDMRYYDEIADYAEVVSSVFTENAINKLERSYFKEGPIVFNRDGKYYHICNTHDSMATIYFAEISSIKLVEQNEAYFTYQVEAKYSHRADSLDDPPILGEPRTYDVVFVRKDGKLLIDEFTYPNTSTEMTIDMDRYSIAD